MNVINFTVPSAEYSSIYIGYLLKSLSRINLDRLTFPKIYKPANTKCQVDVLGASIRANTATAGDSTTITLDASSSAVDDFYNGNTIVLKTLTGAGQSRIITGYVGSTKIATVSTWTTNPDNLTTFEIFPTIASNISPGLDLQSIDYTAYPTINILCSLERQTGATASPSMGVPVVTSIEYNTVQRGTGTVALVASQATVNITLSKAVSVNGSRVKAWAKSTSATAYTADIVPILTSETNLQLKLSGSNATTPTEYAWEVEQI